MFRIICWVDGSCYVKTRQGGWCSIAAAMESGTTEEEIAELIRMASACLSPTRTDIDDLTDGGKLRARASVSRGYADDTTNNRMEIKAIIEAVRMMKKPCAMTIVSDSEYAIGVLGRGHRAKVNQDLIQEWRKVSRGFNIKFEHIEGHSGHPLNELCDQIAFYKNGLS